MDSITLARIIGLGVVVLLFIAVILLMPKLLGEDPKPSAARQPHDAGRERRRPVEAPAPATPPVVRDAAPSSRDSLKV